jgi:hypothetical protein
MSQATLLAAESEKLLREIRELRDRRRRAFDDDLAEIDRAYELQLGLMHRAIRRGQIVGDCVMWTTIIAILTTLLLAV